MSDNTRYTGTVNWFNNKKGYGFLSHDDSSRPDVFVHYSAIEGQHGYKQLNDGEAVTFEIEIGRNDKPQAARVQRVGK